MPDTPQPLRLALPKGRMHASVIDLLADAGVQVRATSRGYRPALSIPDTEVKILKPHNTVQMLAAGVRDLGFAGADWVSEFGAELVELLDTGLDPVRLVAAAPEALLDNGRLPSKPLRIATEYVRLTERWIERTGIEAEVIRSYGATEVFPPEDADLIVDNTATGSTLAANDLLIIDELMRSSTRLYASVRAMERPETRERIEAFVTLLRSVLDARSRVMLEVNASEASLGAVIDALPAMRRPTVSPLHGGDGFAVRAAVPRSKLAALIPLLKSRGATDIVVTQPRQIVP
ncbi:MAG: ATP phosphoribosyltransferase [Phycisphaerales bacterium]|nr:MAG: ATP phosphoribosyltransferase [Phycisphaerales bacterium]